MMSSLSPEISEIDLLESETGRLAASISPSNFSDQRFAMLTAYYDESGTHENSPINVLAGICGEVHECARFEREWNKVLNGYNVPFAHAKSLHHRQHIYRGWSRKKADSFINQLFYVLQEHKHLTITKTILNVASFDEVYKKQPRNKKERLDSKYALCVRACLHFIARLAFETIDRNPVANFVLEQGHKNAGDAVRVWKEVKADKRLPWTESVGMLSFGEKRGNPLLQAADLLAYAIFKNETGDPNEQGLLSDLEYEMEKSGLIITNHFITDADLLDLRANAELGLPNNNVFTKTEAHFDDSEYYGLKDSADDFEPIVIIDADPKFVQELRKKVPPRSLFTKGWH